jgi:hypothetical protein
MSNIKTIDITHILEDNNNDNNNSYIYNIINDYLLSYVYNYFYGYNFIDSNIDNKEIIQDIKNKNLNFKKSINRLSDIDIIIDSNNNKNNIILEDNFNMNIKFKSKEFIDIIYETYPTESDIIKQFSLDFPRQTITINNILIDTPKKFFDYIAPINELLKINDIETNTILFIMLLICQSTFYLAFLNLHKKLNNIKENNKIYKHYELIYIGNKKDIINDCINIDINEQKIITAQFKSKYRIFDIKNNKIIFDIKSIINYSSNNDICSITYNTI